MLDFWEGREFEDGAGSLLSSFSFFSFPLLGLTWLGGFQNLGCPKHNLFLGRKEEWRGEERGGEQGGRNR